MSVIYVDYGEYGLSAYRYVLQGPPPPHDAFMEQYGPAYVMLGSALASLTSAVGAPWHPVVTWHAFYFLTFLGCIELMYQFSRRWLSTAASLGTAVLFASQPLLWGHAFINPKDIPFLALFLASVHLGFSAVDRFRLSRFSALWVLAAAVVLGVTVSIRSGGPLAGLLVAVYSGVKLGRKCLPFLAGYAAVAAAVTVSTWPFLWHAPFERLLAKSPDNVQLPFLHEDPVHGGILRCHRTALVLCTRDLRHPADAPRSHPDPGGSDRRDLAGGPSQHHESKCLRHLVAVRWMDVVAYPGHSCCRRWRCTTTPASYSFFFLRCSCWRVLPFRSGAVAAKSDS